MVGNNPRVLLVEGDDDLYAIAELIGSYIDWPKKSVDAPVNIVSRGGVTNVLDHDTIPIRLKSPAVQFLGVLVDADNEFDKRWCRIQDLVRPYLPNIPNDLPLDGLICADMSGKRFGVWIMPDNSSRGMLETFLQVMVPSAHDLVWEQAKSAVTSAVNSGAPCNPAHIDKAQIHTWLAWQDPPGERFGTAILQKIFDPKSPGVNKFVNWFLELYQL